MQLRMAFALNIKILLCCYFSCNLVSYLHWPLSLHVHPATLTCLIDGVMALTPKITTAWNPNNILAKISNSLPVIVEFGQSRLSKTSFHPEQNATRTSTAQFWKPTFGRISGIFKPNKSAPISSNLTVRCPFSNFANRAICFNASTHFSCNPLTPTHNTASVQEF